MTAELKKWRHTFYSLSLNLKQYIHKFQRGKDLFITLSIVYIQISNAYLPEFLNISINVEANPVWICRQCLYSAVIFNSKLDYWRPLSDSRLLTNNLIYASPALFSLY